MIHRASKNGMLEHLKPLLAEERGATATEYGVLMAFIVMATLVVITHFGLELRGWYDELTVHLKLLLGIP